MIYMVLVVVMMIYGNIFIIIHPYSLSLSLSLYVPLYGNLK